MKDLGDCCGLQSIMTFAVRQGSRQTLIVSEAAIFADVAERVVVGLWLFGRLMKCIRVSRGSGLKGRGPSAPRWCGCR